MKYRIYNIDCSDRLPNSVIIDCDGDITMEGANLIFEKYGCRVKTFEFEPYAYYISFEQEAVLSDHFPLANNRLDYGYVVISDVPWDAEGPDWKPIMIGPMKEQEYDQGVLQQIANLLRASGNKVAVCGEGDLYDARGYAIPT